VIGRVPLMGAEEGGAEEVGGDVVCGAEEGVGDAVGFRGV